MILYWLLNSTANIDLWVGVLLATGDLALAAELANHKSTETTRAFYCKPQTKSDVMAKINSLKNKQKQAENE